MELLLLKTYENGWTPMKRLGYYEMDVQVEEGGEVVTVKKTVMYVA